MEEEQEPQSNYYPNQGDPSDIFMKAMIDVEDTLQKFEMETLRRKRLKVDTVNKTKEWVAMAEGVNPICNELGISEILGILRGRATIIGRLTKKTDTEINKDMFQFHRTLIETFSLRADEWELDEELFKALLESCLSIVQDIIFSSRGGFTAMNIRSTYSRHEQSNVTPESRGKKVLGVKVN